MGGNVSATPPRDPSDRDPPHQGEGGAPNDDLLDITRRVEALGAFLATEDGTNLLAGTRRTANILAAEEKKGTRVAASVDPALLTELEEKALADAIDRAESELADALKTADYAAAMAALARLRAPVDAFFDTVLVNAEDEAVRANRLALLSRIRTATRAGRRFRQDRRVRAGVPTVRDGDAMDHIGQGAHGHISHRSVH